jgi:sugar lactone lactonase YvrE
MTRTGTVLLTGCLLAAGLIIPSLHAQSFTFTTVAGGSQGSMDGLNASAQFYNPSGVAVDGGGNMYVADQANNLIREISPQGTNWMVSTIAGGAQGSLDGNNTNAQFFGPSGITVDKSGNLYVADQYNSVIRQISLSGRNWVVSTIAGTAGVSGNEDGSNGNARFSNPTGIAVDGAGNLFVADEVNNAIRKVTPSGSDWVVTTIAGGAQGASDGTNTTAEFFRPHGVAVDSGGRVFVADQFNNTIRLIKPVGINWMVTTIAGQSVSGLSDGLGTNSSFDAPVGVAVDSNDNVYVADLFNNAIRKLTPSGINWEVSTIAGGASGFNNGTGANASFNLPFGVAADAYGDVFVADTQNNAIRLGLSATSLPPTGALEVMITSSKAVSAGAKWQLDGGTALHTNGAILSGLVPGNHAVSFTKIAGFTTPAAQTVPVTVRQTTLTTGNYSVAVANAGSLQVMISPSGSINAGALWQVGGGAWQTNGGIVTGLSVGTHTLSFYPISGWTTPSSQAVAITLRQTTLATGAYVLQTGSLQVTLAPSAVIIAGAKWQVNGGTPQASGATLSGLLPGNYTVSFKTVLGWSTPVAQVVTINNTLTTPATATYTLPTQPPQPTQLTGMIAASGGLQFVVSGTVGSGCVVQASSDLAGWTPISTNTIPEGGSMTIIDTDMTKYNRRFYRAVGQ